MLTAGRVYRKRKYQFRESESKLVKRRQIGLPRELRKECAGMNQVGNTR